MWGDWPMAQLQAARPSSRPGGPASVAAHIGATIPTLASIQLTAASGQCKNTRRVSSAITGALGSRRLIINPVIMKRAFLLAAAAMLIALSGRPQGYFNFSTLGIVRTHIGSIDGPLAGANIWAQMLAGSTPDALAPVAVPAQHLVLPSGPTGWVNAGAFTVPGIGGFDTAYMEMVVWDGARWGTVLSVVPKDQLGMTDTV